MNDFVLKQLMSEFPVRQEFIQNTLMLFEEGNTIPFIARYRKEWTGNLDEVQLREIKERYDYLVDLQERKCVIINTISEQGKLTPDLEGKINACLIKQELEDIYLPFKPKKRTKATEAMEKGLGPLAEIIMAQELTQGDLEDIARPYLCEEKGVLNIEQAYIEAGFICSEKISEMADLRKFIRDVTTKKGIIVCKVKRGYEDQPTKFNMYYDYQEPINGIASHRVLAIRRGMKEGVLSVSIQSPVEEIIEGLRGNVIKNQNSIFTQMIEYFIDDAYKRLIEDSIEKQIWNELKEVSDGPAIAIFSKNLRDILLTPPVFGKIIMGIDPGQRTGCKIAIIDNTGKFLDSATIYPHPPVNKRGEALTILLDLIDKFQVEYIAIGNGTASRETEVLVRELLSVRAREEAGWEVMPVVVNEAGASVYSASDVAREEFPNLDVTIRGAISIARRLQDPLAELVKIDPKSIGVGQYQHDVDQKSLKKALDEVVESCVNYVGVDLNTASASLLRYVSGIGPQLAKQIISRREDKGGFKNRTELLDIPRFGAKAFEQSAGFLRIRNGDQPLDNSAVHPESYYIVEAMSRDKGVSISELMYNLELINQIDPDTYITEKAGLPTITDIIEELKKPGRDPRGEIKSAKFRSDVISIEDLKEGMLLEGVVTNITDFGAFVDIGVHNDGLLHISKMGKRYIKDPRRVCSIGDVIKVKVISIDLERKRIGLSMKDF